jgi:hypothetical protein
MFYMSLKYIHSIYFTTCFNHTGPSSGNTLFSRNISHCTQYQLYSLSMSLFINLVLYGVPSSNFLYCSCSVHHWVYRLLVVCVLETGQVFLDLPNGMLFIQIIQPSPSPFVTLCNKLIFYGEELLAPRPTPLAGGPPRFSCQWLPI